jgi:hypothetical protein
MEESISHLFFECPNFAGLWYHVCNWLGTVTTLRNEAMAHLDQFEGLIGSGRALRLRVSVIWFAGIWSIWKSRNDKLFNNKDISMYHMIEEVKRLSWNWLKYKSNSMDYDIVHWYLNPRACLGCVD